MRAGSAATIPRPTRARSSASSCRIPRAIRWSSSATTGNSGWPSAKTPTSPCSPPRRWTWPAPSRPCGESPRLEQEELLDGRAQGLGELQRQDGRGHEAAVLHGIEGLAGDAHELREFLLGEAEAGPVVAQRVPEM